MVPDAHDGTHRDVNPPENGAIRGGEGKRASGPSSSLGKSVLVKICKLTAFAAVLAFVGRELVMRLMSVRWGEIELSGPFLALAFVAAIVAKFTRVFSLRAILRCFSRPPDLFSMMAIAWLPQIGKYVPGKVASVVGSVWLLRRKGVSSPAAIGSVFVVDGIGILVGLGLAIPLTLWAPVRQSLPAAWLWSLGLLGVVLVCLHPKVFGALGNFVLRKLKRQELRSLPSLRQYAGPAALILVQFSALGIALWCTGRSLATPPIAHIPLFVSAVSLAGTVGFLALFAPAGLGVREAILLVILGPVFGSSTAALVVVALRLVLTTVEVLLAAVGLLILKLQSRAQRSCSLETSVE